MKEPCWKDICLVIYWPEKGGFLHGIGCGDAERRTGWMMDGNRLKMLTLLFRRRCSMA